MAGSTSIFATSIFFGCFFPLAMLVFEFLRHKYPDIYAPLARSGHPASVQQQPGLFMWVYQVYELPNELILELAGMDAYVMLRSLRLCMILCGIYSIGAVCMLPVYWTAQSPDISYDMNRLSMANIFEDGTRLWASFLFTYIFTLLTLYMMHLENENILRVRDGYFQHLGHSNPLVPAQMRHTIKVEGVPKHLCKSADFRQFFENLFPGEVLFAHIFSTTYQLENEVKKRNVLVGRLELSVAKYEAHSKSTRPLTYLYLDGTEAPLHMYPYALQWLGAALLRLCGHALQEKDEISWLTGQLLISYKAVRQAQMAVLATTEEPDAPAPVPAPDNDADSEVTTVTFRALAEGAAHAPMGEGGGVDVGEGGSVPTVGDIELSTLNEAGEQEATGGSLAKMRLRDKKRLLSFDPESVAKLVESAKDSLVSQFVSTTGFVTFARRSTQLAACKLKGDYPSGMKVGPSPAPLDLVWKNMGATNRSIKSANFLTSVAYYAGLAAWSVVLAFVSSLTNLSRFAPYVPFLRQKGVQEGLTFAIMQGLLPALVLMGFNACLAWMMKLVARKIERRKTESSIELEVFRWQFAFQFYNIYFILAANVVTTDVGTLLSFIELLSAALPITAAFFINYIITYCLGGVLVVLVRINDTLSWMYQVHCRHPLRVTRNQLVQGPLAGGPVDYCVVLPNYLYILSVVLLFWVIAPVVQLVGTIYFSTIYLTYKYKYSFTAKPRKEGGGQFWHGIYRCMMVGLLASTFFGIFYMGIKRGFLQGGLMLPLPLVTLAYWRRMEADSKRHSMKHHLERALQQFSDAGAADDAAEPKDLREAFDADMYRAPSVTGPARLYPFPHRVLDIALLTPDGVLDEVYLDDIPAGEDPDEYVLSTVANQQRFWPGVRSEHSQVALGAVYSSLDSTRNPIVDQDSHDDLADDV